MKTFPRQTATLAARLVGLLQLLHQRLIVPWYYYSKEIHKSPWLTKGEIAHRLMSELSDMADELDRVMNQERPYATAIYAHPDGSLTEHIEAHMKCMLQYLAPEKLSAYQSVVDRLTKRLNDLVGVC